MPDTLHLAAWNVNHRTGRKSIPPDTLHAIASLDIDVLVLTEFVDGDHHTRFKESLKDIGFSSLAVSVKAPRQNQVLIAARSPLADDGLLPLPGHTEAATTNWLHRRLPALKLEIVGFRAPMYLAADDRTGYWNQVEGIARSARDRRVIFLGDFQLDPRTDTRPCARVFPRLRRRASAWRNPGATGATTPATAATAPASTTPSRVPRSPSRKHATSTRPVATRSPVRPTATVPRSPTTRCSRSDSPRLAPSIGARPT